MNLIMTYPRSQKRSLFYFGSEPVDSNYKNSLWTSIHMLKIINLLLGNTYYIIIIET